MQISPQKWAEAERWFARARDNLRAAKVLHEAEPSLKDAAAFHCQQAAEKLAKGLLVAARQRPPKRHDIEELASLLRPHLPSFAERLAQIAGITSWYFGTRYPDMAAESSPTPEDVTETLEQLRKLDREIAKLAPPSP
jgi:HEPN domain-containing protein